MYRFATFSAVAILAIALSSPADARRRLGGIDDAQGSYSVLFSQQEALPRPALTPGALNRDVTPQTLRQTICRRGGYTKSIRPDASYTNDLKRRQIREYGFTDLRVRDYEEDHLVPLELGGNPTDPRNLWPEPRHVAGGWGADRKDELENRLHSMVCHGELPLATAQRAIAANWQQAYATYVR